MINPTRSNIGKISKCIIDRINNSVVDRLSFNQWKSTKAVLQWFSTFDISNNYVFIVFDVVDFYPSITCEPLSSALDFASRYDSISDEERNIIMHSRKSLLVCKNTYWGKKNQEDLFDVTMGSNDGAEVCELVGSYLLHQIYHKFGPNFGLYRDDGLGITSSCPRHVERVEKGICELFKKNRLKITIEANKKVLNYVSFGLTSAECSTKPKQGSIIYINANVPTQFSLYFYSDSYT